MNTEISKFVSEVADKHAQKVDKLTRVQFEEALEQAIKSGDFAMSVSVDNEPMMMQDPHTLAYSKHYSVSYIPYRDKARLQERVSELEALLKSVIDTASLCVEYE